MIEMDFRTSITIVFVIFQVNYLSACMCGYVGIAEDSYFQKYEEIFLGNILKIERVEIMLEDGDESFPFVCTETTFKVIKKWKGSSNNIVKIFQIPGSCGAGYTINSSTWIVSAHYEEYPSDILEKKYTLPPLQTNGCYLNIYHFDKDNLQEGIEKLDALFPNEIKLSTSKNQRQQRECSL